MSRHGLAATMFFPGGVIWLIIMRMNLPRFYCREAMAPGAHIELPEPVARHAIRVLRLPPGAPIVLFDGRGGEYEGRIERIDRDRVVAALGAWHDVERESPLEVTLVQAVQAGEKMDLTVQKAVELGVTQIVPVASRRSVTRLAGERAARRVAHWQGVAAAACEQCGRNQVPQVAPLEKLEFWLARPAGNGTPAGPRARRRAIAGQPGAGRAGAVAGRRRRRPRSAGNSGRWTGRLSGSRFGAAHSAHGDRGTRGAGSDAGFVG